MADYMEQRQSLLTHLSELTDVCRLLKQWLDAFIPGVKRREIKRMFSKYVEQPLLNASIGTQYYPSSEILNTTRAARQQVTRADLSLANFIHNKTTEPELGGLIKLCREQENLVQQALEDFSDITPHVDVTLHTDVTVADYVQNWAQNDPNLSSAKACRKMVQKRLKNVKATISGF